YNKVPIMGIFYEIFWVLHLILQSVIQKNGRQTEINEIPKFLPRKNTFFIPELVNSLNKVFTLT
ncbi:hypothetical protein, partial [Staphylococcus pettenkoferi]|uniref:hypothetical protein n=1 Tax=Staphylococcus pettenkoferi TaxID=170573 RepID=UPI001C92F693